MRLPCYHLFKPAGLHPQGPRQHLACRQDVLQQRRGAAPPGPHTPGLHTPAHGGRGHLHPPQPVLLTPTLQAHGTALPFPPCHQHVSPHVDLEGILIHRAQHTSDFQRKI